MLKIKLKHYQCMYIHIHILFSKFDTVGCSCYLFFNSKCHSAAGLIAFSQYPSILYSIAVPHKNLEVYKISSYDM